MKVGDLVRRREPHGYDIIVEYLIFIGDGLWAGWGNCTQANAANSGFLAQFMSPRS